MTSSLSPGSPSQRPARSPGSLADRGPTTEAVRAAEHARTTALLVYGIPVALLMGGLYWRLAVSTLPLRLGLVSWLLPAAIAAVVFAVLWALIVEPNSRGNALGDQLRTSGALDDQTVAEDNRLVEQGREIAEYGEMCTETAQTEILEAHERVTDLLEVSHRSLQVATAALGVPDVPMVRSENLTRPTLPHIERIEAKIQSEVATHRELVSRLGLDYMPVLAELPPPHEPFGEPAEVRPGTEHIDSRSLPSYAGSTLYASAPDDPRGEPRHRLWRTLLVALVVALVIATVVWLLVGKGVSSLAAAPSPTSTSAVTPTSVADAPTRPVPDDADTWVAAHPPQPGDLKEGIDYAFLDRVQGRLVRWSCSSPITVRLAGPAPAGAANAVRSAVGALRSASGLPLVFGSPLQHVITAATDVPTGTITYSYLTTAQVKHSGLNLTGDVLGEGGPLYDSSGQIESGWVAIRADGSADPETVLGEKVAWHEGAHTLNLGHAQQHSAHPEIMEPTADSAGPMAWGPGDRYALAAVGCTPKR